MSTPANFSKAVRVAKKLHRDHGNKPWFRSTSLYQFANEIAVKVVFNSEFSNDVKPLAEEKILEDGVLVTFSSF